MAFTTVAKDMNIIAALPDEPNDAGGLTAAQLKAKFDEGGLALKTYINGTLLSELEDTAAGQSGAGNIGVEAITGVTGSNVQDVLEDLKSQLDGVSQGAVADGSITTAKLADGAVTTAKIPDSAVTTVKVNDAAVTAAKLAADAVETAKIKDANVTTAKLADTAVTTAKLGVGAVASTNIASGAVTADKTSFLTATYYGDNLPASGTEGQIFFKKV